VTAELSIDEVRADYVPRPRPTVASVEVDGQAVLFDAASGATHQLDQVGTVVWGQFDGSATLADHSAELAKAFGADPGTVERDVTDLARVLGASGLLVGIQPGHRRGQRLMPKVTEREGIRYIGVPGSI